MPVSKTTIFLVLCAIIAAVCGFLGFTMDQSQFKNQTDPQWKVLEDLYLTARLFVLEGPRPLPKTGSISNSDILLNIARFLAPVSLGGALLMTAIKFWSPKLDKLKARLVWSHVIVVGAGEVANKFLRHFGTGGTTAISVASSNDDIEMLNLSSGRRGLVFQGSPLDAGQWRSISSHRADIILLADVDDQENLAVAKSLADLNLVPSVKRPKIFCLIENTGLRNELISQTVLSDASNQLRIEPFSISELASRAFFQERDFFWEASIRNQKRIHWFVVGASEFNFAFLQHFLAIAPHPKFEMPLVTLVSDSNSEDISQFNFLAKQCEALLEIRFFERSEFEKTLKSHDALASLDTSVTATLMDADENESAVELALSMRRASFRDPMLKAPIFFAGENLGNWNIGNFGKLSRYLHDEMSPIANVSELCTAEALSGSRDLLAREFHNHYLASIKVRDPKKTPSHETWNKLDESFRRSNRRAADHSKTKYEFLAILGSQKIDLSKSKILEDCTDEKIELLAKAEHESWMADRLIHGWKFAEKRDDVRWLHPDLVPYADLDEATKDLDRTQVRELIRKFSDDSTAVSGRKVISVGLIGRIQISLEEAKHISQTLSQDTLPRLFQDYPEARFRFFTPLAPGSDLVSAQAVETFLADREQIQKIYIVECADPSSLVEVYQVDRRPESCWGLNEEQLPMISELTEEILGCIRSYSKRHQTVNICTKRDQTFRQLIETNADYFATKMDVLIAYEGSNAGRGKFGTTDTVHRAKTNGIDVRLI